MNAEIHRLRKQNKKLVQEKEALRLQMEQQKSRGNYIHIHRHHHHVVHFLVLQS